jgi:hypothetical protein
MHLGLSKWALCAPIAFYGSTAVLLKFQMAPRLIFLILSGSRKEPKYACVSEARASHRQRMWAEVLSSTPHFLHSGLFVNLIKWCLCRVLCLVRSPVTTLDCILLKDKSLILVPRNGLEINSRACLWVLPRFCQRLQYWFPNQRLILFWGPA